VYDHLPRSILSITKSIMVCVSMRQIIYFNDEIYQKLRDYVKMKYGKHRAISFVVGQAVAEFLKREADRDKKTKK